MITIFCDFCQFAAKIGVFLKNQCYDKILAYVILLCLILAYVILLCLSQKRQFFREIFRRKYFKNNNIGPCLDTTHVSVYPGM
jgi:hypothetical protein